MELFDYIKFRWESMLLLLLLGCIAIVALGMRSGSSAYVAETELLVRPPASTLASYASDLDRFIDTEMRLLYTPENLSKEVGDTGASPELLGATLSFTHEPGSETVELQVSNADEVQAVALVNSVADSYITRSRERFSAPARREASDVRRQIEAVQADLLEVNRSIANAATAYQEVNPDRGVPAATTLTPDAAAQQSVLTGQLQQLFQQQTTLELESSTISRSRVLSPATSASTPPGWGATTYLAALVGLLLVLLTVAGIGFALSNRVLGAGRWHEITRPGGLRRSVRLRSLTSSDRSKTVRRVADALASIGRSGDQTLVVFMPVRTKSVERRTAFLLRGLSDAGLEPKEIGSVSELSSELHSTTPAAPDAPTATRVLLVVDLAQTRVDDVSILSDYPEPLQRVMVPVLV